MQDEGFPAVNIRSKKELARHISSSYLSTAQAMELINTICANRDSFWKDNVHMSEPKKDKYVRNAKHTAYGKLLRLIDQRVLAPHDKLIPGFIFGGLSETDHVKAAANLVGHNRHRSLLKADLRRFFEQVGKKRVEKFFIKSGCSKNAAQLLAFLCCLPKGPKGSNGEETIARGFATSARLAVWCNLNVFQKMYREVKNMLQGHDPRISIYVDDIGVTASHVGRDTMENVYDKIKEILLQTDDNQQLQLNDKKKRIRGADERKEHLGILLNRNSVTLGAKTRWKMRRMKDDDPNKHGGKEKVKRSLAGLYNYKNYVKHVSGESTSGGQRVQSSI